MKKMPILALALASAFLFVNAGQIQADADSATVSITAVSDFYAPLGQYGMWVQVGDYGRCFRPADAGVGWRPYSNGHWEWTDAGWYWVSEQPWGWACYHYGQWTYDTGYGWVWVPGTEWAPSWVCWRVGDGYIGWAPLPPQGHSFARHADDDAFVFVRADHFDQPVSASDVIVNNHDVIEHTRYISSVKQVTRDVAGVGTTRICDNDGPGLETVEKACGKTFQPVPVNEVFGRRPSETRFDSRSHQSDMDRHDDTDRHEDIDRHEDTDRHDGLNQRENRQHESWPPANTQPDSGYYNSGQPESGSYNNSGQSYPQTTPTENQGQYQQRQTTEPRMNGGRNSATPSTIPNYRPQAGPGNRETSPNEGSTERRLEPLQSGQPHSPAGVNPAGRVPGKSLDHSRVIQHGQGNPAPQNGQGQNNGVQNRNQGQ